jgi:hypothetical protein
MAERARRLDAVYRQDWGNAQLYYAPHQEGPKLSRWSDAVPQADIAYDLWYTEQELSDAKSAAAGAAQEPATDAAG